MSKFLAVFAIIAVLAGAIFAIDVSACGTLSAPGTYKLTKDVRAQSGHDCFDVTAQDVRLECGGHTILGNNARYTSGVHSTSAKTAINGCNITGFMIGVRLENSANSLVNGTLITVNYMPYVTEAGVYASSSPNSTVRGSAITSNGPYSYGTYGVESIESSLVSSPQYIAAASAKNVVNSQVSGGVTGVMLNSGASAHVAGSDISGGQYGIDVSIGNALIEGSKIATGYATQSEYAAAVRYFGAGEGNVMRSSKLGSTSGNADLVLAMASKPPVLYWNNFTDTNGAYVVAKSPVQLNAPVNGQQEGNIYYNVISGAVAVQGNESSGYGSGLYVGVNGSGYPYGETSSQGKIMGNATDYAPLTPNYFNNSTAGCVCGELETPNYVCNVTEDLASPGTCFKITAANVTILCNGHSITGTNSSGTYGVLVENAQAKIKDCEIRLFDDSILALGAGMQATNTTSYYAREHHLEIGAAGASVSGFRAYYAASPATNGGNGIAIGTAGSAAISGYQFSGLNTAMIVEGTGTNVTGMNGSATNGIMCTNSAHGNYFDCLGGSISGTGAAGSTGFASMRNKETLKNCAITGFENGIYLLNSNGSLVENVQADASANGIYMLGTNNATVKGSAMDSGGRGIYLSSGSGNYILDSVFHSSAPTTACTIEMYNANGNTLMRVNASSGSVKTLQMYDCSGNHVYGSRLGGSQPYIIADLIGASAGNVFANNTFQSENAGAMELHLDSQASGNLFYWNNFTDPAGAYVSANNASNYLNTTINGKPEGNIYANVISGAVAVQGSVNSGYGYGLYIGMNGTGYPYNHANSQAKIVGGVVDFAPLTPNYFNNSTSPPQGCECFHEFVAGETCNLTQDISSNTSCFTIYVPNVTILCNGYSMTGENYSGSWGILSNADGTVARDCRINGFDAPVVYRADDGLVENVTAHARNLYYGVWFDVNADRNVLKDSFIASEYNAAVTVAGNGNVVSKVTTSTIANNGIGIMYNAKNTTIANSSISVGSGVAVNIAQNATGGRIYNNSLYSGGGPGSVLTLAQGNLFYWNNFTAAGYYIRDLAGGNHYNTTLGGKQEGNIYANVISGAVAVQGNVSSGYGSGLYIGINGTGYPYSASTSQGKIIGAAIDFAPLTPSYFNNSTAPQQGCVCGNLTTPNYVCNVTQNLQSNGTCFSVTAANVTILCNGHSITGANAAGSAGIFSDSAKTIVKNCIVSGFARGVYYDGADGGEVLGTNASTDYPGGHAIYLLDSDNTTIASVAGTSAYGAGICLESSSYNRINDSVGASGIGKGIHVLSGEGNMIGRTSGISASQSGIAVESSSGNTLANCTARSDSLQGILLSGSNGNRIIDSAGIALGNQPGIWLYGSSGNVVNGSTASSNTGKALYISGSGSGANNNTVANSTLISNSTLLALYAAAGNLFYWNNFTATSGHYIYDDSAAMPGYLNRFNSTINGKPEGNIYANVISGAVAVQGSVLSGYGSGLYIGMNGTGYPYKASTAQGKVYDPYGEVFDYAPLTPFYFNNSSSPPQGCVCGVLNVPNYVCNVTEDLTSAGTCFTVQANNVTILCNGHSITGGNLSNTYGIYSAKNKTSVKDCQISNFMHGVTIEGAAYGSIEGTNASTTYTFGLPISLINGASSNTISKSKGIAAQGHGITVANSANNNTITSSVGTSTNYMGIIIGSDSNFNAIVNSSGISTNAFGIQIAGGNQGYNTVSNSTGISINGAGIAIDSDNNQITSSNGTSVAGSGIYGSGIFIYTGSNNTITNAVGNSNYSFGVYLSVSNQNTIANSKLVSNEGTAAKFQFNSSMNIFYNNTLVSGNGNLLALEPTSGSNTFYWNNFTATSGLYIDDLNGGNFYNATINGKPEGNIYANVMSGAVAIQGNMSSGYGSGLYIGMNGTGYPYNAANSQGKIIGNATDFAPLTPNYFNNSSVPPQNGSCVCGNLTTPNFVCNVTEDLASNGTCFTVQAYNVTILCNGHSVTGMGANGTYGVYSNQARTKVVGCALANFGTGVFFNGAGNGTISGTSISAAGNGVYLLSSANNSITGSNITALGPESGILLNKSWGNSITGSIGNSNSGAGIRLYNSSHNRIYGSGGFSSISSGLNITDGSSYNVFANGAVSGNNWIYCAVQITYNASNNTIANSSINGNQQCAVSIWEGNGNALANNTMTQNTAWWALVKIYGSDNLLYWNNFTGNGQYISASGANFYNTTINGKPEGNIYGNVLNGSVAVQGNVSSGYGSGLYIGMNGTGYPYSANTSQGKIQGNAVDYAPLTPFYAADSMPPAPVSDDENGTAKKNVTRIEIPRPKATPKGDPAPKVTPKATPKEDEDPAPKTTPKGDPAPKTEPLPKVTPKATPKEDEEPVTKTKTTPKQEPKTSPKPEQKTATKSEPAVSQKETQQKAAGKQEASSSKAAPAAKGEASAPKAAAPKDETGSQAAKAGRTASD